MNDIDVKLRERMKILDHIDRNVKNETKNIRSNYQGNDKINSIDYYNTNQMKSKNYTNSSWNKSTNRNLSEQNPNISNEYDYPLQYNTGYSKNISTSKMQQDSTSSYFNNLNLVLNPFEKQEVINNNYNNANYFSQAGNEVFSTKEFSEQFTGKSIKNIKIKNDRENTNATFYPNSNRVTKQNNLNTIKTEKTPKRNYHNNYQKNEKNQVGDRLYNHGFYMKEKLERKRIEGENEYLRQMTPEISTKAKMIKRDANKFFERLYPYHKMNNNGDVVRKPTYDPNSDFDYPTPNFDNASDFEEDKQNKIYRKNTTSNTQNHQNFYFNPKLNKNSMKIAENLMPSKIRLLAKKIKNKQNKSLNNELSNVSDISQENSYYSRSRTPGRSRSKSGTPSNYLDNLYSKGLEKMKQREVMSIQKKNIDNEEYKNYTYKPKILKHSPIIDRRISKSPTSRGNKSADNIGKYPEKKNVNFYDKNVHWKKNVDSRKEKMRFHQDNEMQDILTFKPEIQKNIKKNDEKFIMKNLEQIEEYVNKRRTVLQKKKEDEEHSKKKFCPQENYKGKVTVPKEFIFQTNLRGRSKSKDNLVVNNSRSPSPNSIHQIRNKLKTNHFFEQENVIPNNDSSISQNYGYQTKASVLANMNSSRVSDDNNMFAFMSAVNNLHDQLVNFKI